MTGGVQIVVTRHGRLAVHVDPSPGDPLVMLHGLGGDHQQVQSFIPDPRLVTGVVLRRIAIDMRAHGDTEDTGDPASLNIRAFGEDIHDVIQCLNPEIAAPPVTLLGISMGAAVAIEVACRFPELVSRLILIRPSWNGKSRGENAAIFTVLAKHLREGGPGGLEAFTATADYRAIEAVSIPMAASLRRQFARRDAQQRAAVLELIPLSGRMRGLPEIASISVPALVLGAPDDPVHPLEFAATLTEAIPGATLVRLPRKLEGAGEHEARLQGAVREFLLASRA